MFGGDLDQLAASGVLVTEADSSTHQTNVNARDESGTIGNQQYTSESESPRSNSHENAVSGIVCMSTSPLCGVRKDGSGVDVWTSISRLPLLLQDPADSFSFLVRFTHHAGVVHAFESDAVLQMLKRVSLEILKDQSRSGDQGWYAREETCPGVIQRIDTPEATPEHAEHYSLENPVVADTSHHSRNIPEAEAEEEGGEDVWVDTQTSPWSLWAGDELAAKTLEIVTSVHNITIEDQAGCTSSSFPGWSHSMEAMCAHFFSPPKIRIFLEAYWSIWSPNWPVIHRPTFDPSSTPTTLLTALVVLGACHSPNPADRRIARFWYDAVEQLVYRDLSVVSAALNQGCALTAPDNRRRAIQAIQAAYAVCIYQHWDGTRSARARVRRQRFNDIVAASRSFGFSRARHGDLGSLTRSAFDWEGFILEEETIRTLLWVYLLDTGFTIFNNTPPRIALRELSMGLACSEACFQAETPSKCFNSLKLWMSRIKRPPDLTLYSLIKMFCAADMTGVMLDRVSHEAYMNLWCIVASFHVMIFNLDPSLGNTSQFAPIRTGLSNWKSVWNQRYLNDDERFFDAPIMQPTKRDGERQSEHLQQIPADEPNLWKRSGFWKHAPEFWLLATLYLDRLQYAAGPIVQVEDDYDDNAMTRVKSFIESFQRGTQ